jgi:hypothetical protein
MKMPVIEDEGLLRFLREPVAFAQVKAALRRSPSLPERRGKATFRD